MSFWDHIKPSEQPPQAQSVETSADQRAVSLVWDDGVRSTVTARRLRQACPCAECIDEWTRQPTLDPDSVPETIKILEVRPVGNYALAFVFSDAHRTGIFNWSLLRTLSAPTSPA